MEILPNVPLQGIIQSHFTSEVIKKEIQDRLLHIPNIDFLKGTIQMVSLVCNMVEELTPANNRNKGKLDKKQMALDILAKLFELTQLEIGISGKKFLKRMHSEHLGHDRIECDTIPGYQLDCGGIHKAGNT
jgi:hypothetical protein